MAWLKDKVLGYSLLGDCKLLILSNIAGSAAGQRLCEACDVSYAIVVLFALDEDAMVPPPSTTISVIRCQTTVQRFDTWEPVLVIYKYEVVNTPPLANINHLPWISQNTEVSIWLDLWTQQITTALSNDREVITGHIARHTLKAPGAAREAGLDLNELYREVVRILPDLGLTFPQQVQVQLNHCALLHSYKLACEQASLSASVPCPAAQRACNPQLKTLRGLVNLFQLRHV